MKADVDSTVHLVVARDCSVAVEALPKEEPVWLAATAKNKEFVEKLAGGAQSSASIQSFEVDEARTPEEWVLAVLDPIHLQHPSPPFTRLNVIGAVPSSRLHAELQEYGFLAWEETPEGFLASKDAPL